MARRVLLHLQAILETGSVADAAKKLYVSQPSLSQYVRRLEEEYDISIFDRSSQPWSLTPEGKFFIEIEKEIEAIEQKRRQYFADRNALLSGEITIGTTQYRTSALLGPVLSEFRARYPNIRIKLVEQRSKELASLVLSGHVDCAFVVDVFIPREHIESIPVFTEEVLLCTPKTHPLAQNYRPETTSHPVIDFECLKNEPFIVLHPGQALRLYFDRLCEKYGFTPTIALESQSVTTVPAMVKAGLGIALIPSPLIEPQSQDLCYFSLGEALPPNPLSIISNKKRYLSKAAHAFIEMAVRILNKG